MLFSTVLLLVATLQFVNAIPTQDPQGTLHRRSYFYVGQSYIPSGNSTVAFGQMYVEHLIPAKVTQTLPLVMIHGHGMTGTNFLNTPDGRLGWADFFLSKGYEVYLVDQPARGRSTYQDIDGELDESDTFTIQSRFTATQLFNLWPQASLHTQWPGNGSVGDPIFDGFYASVVRSIVSNTVESEQIKVAGVQLFDMIGPAVLLTHSQSGPFGWIIGDARPSKIKAIVALEPTGPPFMEAVFSSIPARPWGVTEIPLTFSPPAESPDDIQRTIASEDSGFTCFKQADPPRQLVNLAKVPIAIVTSESSYHAVYDNCTAQFLVQAGVSATHINLGDIGFHGNGHMMFLEKNSLEIADFIEQQITRLLHP
ncbi:hypothetical protein AMATHDRAFT_139154 [Amanita thiersii Skay4041]|uniref:AB hydrolase-1 domain-containing protein n=1 Tax=Amanita thiersii Skay4041 TaxID=703135 RepID=A0A2A9NYF7_9AGAR|nr:hypothetical protein AMATHDRAFT_139154 [Amanita thiersii Skay4041]